jgi:hypothetical protein
VTRLYVRDPLPMARVWMKGPRWRRAFGVTRRKSCAPPEPGHPLMKRTYHFYDFTEDVRELACEEIRSGRYAEWTDPREQFS